MSTSTGRPVGRPANVPVAGEREGAIPRCPESVTTKLGKETWKRIWNKKNGQLIPTQDYFFATMICEAVEDIARMKAYLAGGEDILWINNDTNLILHPYIKQINELQKQLTTWYSALGFSPADRAKMRLVEEKVGAVDSYKVLQDMISGNKNGS